MATTGSCRVSRSRKEDSNSAGRHFAKNNACEACEVNMRLVVAKHWQVLVITDMRDIQKVLLPKTPTWPRWLTFLC